jgi:CP family cyanate transporter-like MFS transporter
LDSRRWRANGPTVWLSALGVVLVAFAMRQAVAGVPPVLGDLGLPPERASLLVTIPVVCFSLGALAGPALRARFGEERAIFITVALLLGGLLLRAVWPEWGLFPGTVVAGLTIAVLNVLLPSLVKRRFSHQVGTMMAAYTVAMTSGAALAAGLTVPVLRAADGSLSVALGVWAIPVGLAVVAWLPQLRVTALARRDAGAGRELAIWRHPLAWHVLVFMGLQSLLYYGPLSWLPQIYRDRGVDPADAGFLLMVFNSLGIVGNLAAPVLASRLSDQRPAVAGALAFVGVGLLGITLAPTWTALVWMALLGVAQGACLSLALLLIVLRSADGNVAAHLSSMAQSGGYALAAAGPLVMGALHGATGGWTAPLFFLLAVAVVIWLPGLSAARDLHIGEPGKAG